MKRVTWVVVFGMLGVACAAETAPADRRSSAPDTTTEAQKPIPPEAIGNDGREDSSTMCFAACQNVAFNCKGQTNKALVFNAELTFEMPGCWGSMSQGTTATADAAVKLKLDCNTRKVCLGAAPGADPETCAQGTFSAFSFSFPRGTDGNVVCTRE
jgi:hypothetical protein